MLTGVGCIGIASLAGCAGYVQDAATGEEAGLDDGEAVTATPLEPVTTAEADETEPAETTPAIGESAALSTSFEESGLPGSLVDASESGAEPLSITEAYAASGSRSLRLSSNPGTASKARVATRDTFALPVRFSVRLKQVETRGSQNTMNVTLIDPRTEAKVTIKSSQYFRNVQVEGRNSTTGGDPTYQRELRPTGAIDEWRRFTLEVSDGTVTAGVGGDSVTMPIPTPLETGGVYASVGAGAWGNGDPVSAAVDDFAVETL